jgi:hypothetical protein
MAVVDCFDAVFGVKVKEGSGEFISGRFCGLAKSFQVKGFFVPVCSLKVLGIVILTFLVWGGDDVHVFVPVAVLDLCHQLCIASFTKECHEEPLGESCILEEIKQKGCNLFVHHMDEVFGHFSGWYDCKD